MSIHSVPGTGHVGQPPVQPAAQPPAPPPPAQPPAAPPPAPPQLRNITRGDDPRGIKRDREEDSSKTLEPSEERVIKQARTEPAPNQMHPAHQALFDAIDAGDKLKVEISFQSLLQSLLTSSRALINAQCQGDPGDTPLCRAARRGVVDIVVLLLRYGASVDTCARNGYTALMFAAAAGHVDVIRALVKAGADLHAKVHWVSKNSAELSCSALLFAVRANHFEACKCLIELGANVQQELILLDGESATVVTPLGWSLKTSKTELIGWLLDTQKLGVESLESASKMPLINAAAKFGGHTHGALFGRARRKSGRSYA